MKLKLLIVVVLLIATAGFAEQNTFTFTDGGSLIRFANLVEKAGTETLNADDLSFYSYGVGFYHGILSASYMAETNHITLPYKLPKNSSSNQLGLVVKKFLYNNPEILHERAYTIVYRALTATFPNPEFKPTTKP